METAKCTYCGKERPMTELKKATIIFQNSRQGFDRRTGRIKWIKFVDEKEKLYCADKSCAEHDQMAHEG